jgi:hypothetical protein
VWLQAAKFFHFSTAKIQKNINMQNFLKKHISKQYYTLRLIFIKSFNAKIKAFIATLRGVVDLKFFLFRLTKIYA